MPFHIDTGAPGKHKVYMKNPVNFTVDTPAAERQLRFVFMGDGTVVQYDVATSYLKVSGVRSDGPEPFKHVEVDEEVPGTLRATTDQYRHVFRENHVIPCNLIAW